jgi:hypothetical protein
MIHKKVFITGTPLAGVRTTVVGIRRILRLPVESASKRWDEIGFDLADFHITLRQSLKSTVPYDPADPNVDNAQTTFIRDLDAIIYVADSQCERQEANLWGIENMKGWLIRLGHEPSRVPIVFQLNKRDLPETMTEEEFCRLLTWPRCEYVATTATMGHGLDSLLSAVSRCLVGREPNENV